MLFSNLTDGETISFKYYHAASGEVFCLSETVYFESDMIIANAIAPFTFNLDVEFVLGCNDQSACNYDPTSNFNDGSCEYPEEFYDCDGNCLSDSDADGICDEEEILGCTNEDALNFNQEATEDDGSCILLGCTDELACNYDESATDDNGTCEYAEEFYDCDGNCIADFDCLGECGGDTVVDECGECGGDGSSCAECESDPATWQINPAEYQYNGSVTAAVIINDAQVGSEDDLLAGFVGCLLYTSPSPRD